MANVNKVIVLGNLGRDPEIRYMPSGDVFAAICADYRVSRISASFKKKPAFAGPETKQKAKDAGSSTTTVGTAPPGAADASSSGDDDGGDGDGDSDGPRRPPKSSLPLLPIVSPRAHRRSRFPTPLTRSAFAWLLTLALLLAYVGPPGFALLFVRLGHPELAGDMLRYKPVLILPTPPGWTTSGRSEGEADTRPTVTANASDTSAGSRARPSTLAVCTSSTGINVSPPARSPAEGRLRRPFGQHRTMTSRAYAASMASESNPHHICNGASASPSGANAAELIGQH